MLKQNLGAGFGSCSGLTGPFKVRFRWCGLSAVLLMMLLAGGRVQAAEIDLETRAELQLALQQYIDAGTVDGVYEHFNVERGEVQKLRLKALHPVIFVIESKFMLCADFMDADGEAVMLDYIVGASATGFRIEQEIAGQRSYLVQIFERIN